MTESESVVVRVLDAIQKSREFLEGKGIESARLESELLLGHVLGLPRLKLYLQFERVLTNAEIDALRALVKRRGTREPLQHILGAASFCGLELRVNSDVLIPRPETELLAELGWKFLNSLGRPCTFLDFGTGSGCLAIALAHFSQNATGTAVDLSTAALGVALENARSHGLQERINFVQSNGLEAVQDSSFDLIVSNPPYIPTGDIAGLQPEVRDHDPRSALDGGPDGLEFYRLLASQALPLLNSGGQLMCEFGDGQAPAVREVFATNGWNIVGIEPDLSGRARLLIARVDNAAP